MMKKSIYARLNLKLLFLTIALFLLSGGLFHSNSYALAADDPHLNFSKNKCASCHITHTAKGSILLLADSVNTLCYLCHDAGGQSKFDVESEFGKSVSKSSHHKVPEGTQQCTDCHDPHGAVDSNNNPLPADLTIKAQPTVTGGNDFCFACHSVSNGLTKAILPNNFPIDGVGHNSASFEPASGTKIRCEGCHEKHASDLSYLLKIDPNGDTSLSTGDNKTFCVECHKNASPDNRYLGYSIFNNSKHSFISSTNTNASYPGIDGHAGQCQNCHDPHGSGNGTSKVAMKTLYAPYNDYPISDANKGTINYTLEDFTFCFKCHNSTSTNSKFDIQTQFNGPLGGHYIKRAGGNLAVGSKIPCEDCHNIHGSANNNQYLLKDSLGSNLGDGINECLACHTAGQVIEGLTMNALPNGVPQHSDNITPCINCHGSPHLPSSGLSTGGENCGSCHSNTAAGMKSTSLGYYHLMSDTTANYATGLSSKNCLSCHVDHNKFNNIGQKSFNLKQNYTQTFPTSDQSLTGSANTDYLSSDITYGGICLSCHKNKQVKSNPQQSGSLETQPISISVFASANAHNYAVQSSFSDGSTFYAVCVKCHNDDMAKVNQKTLNRFSLHNSSYQSILSPFDDINTPVIMNEKFCYRCHSGSGTTDPYGTLMNQASKNVNLVFNSSTGSKHDLSDVTGLKCVSCHGPHSVAKSMGASSSNISDPFNTLNPFTTTSGNLSEFCIRCHGLSPPSAVNNDTAFVPSTILFPATTFSNIVSGWNKASYTTTGHYSKQYNCDSCHDKHGSGFARLLIKGEDTNTADGICLSCHNGTISGAANVKIDLTVGQDNTYRHSTLFITGKHSDTESYPMLTQDRHASCVDCHDPHSANGTTATKGDASGKIANVLGVTPLYPEVNSTFAAPLSYTSGIVNKEYQLCFKCHSGFNGNFPNPPVNTFAETDLAKEFNPINPSFHDVGLFTGVSKSYIASFQPGGNLNGDTVLYCTSCHGSDVGTATLTSLSSPAHGSVNQYMLKGQWNSLLTIGNSSPLNNICLKCHDISSVSSRFTNGSSNLHLISSHSDASCQSCHSEVPHGGKRPSLIVVVPGSPSINNGSYSYDISYDGLYGKNSKLYLYNWKSGGTYWNKADCGGCHI